MARARLEATVGLKTGAFRRGVATLRRMASGARRSIAGAFRFGRNLFVGFIAGAAAAAAAAGVLIGKAKEQREATARLEAVQKATGFTSGFTTSELQDQAKELSKLTGATKPVITNTQAVIATFKNVRGDVFRDATAAVLDMAQLFGSADSAAVALGKALNDPVQGITALQRVGVTFTDAQKEQIKTMTEAGDIAGAQGVILQELRSQFGGTAAAVNEADAGLANLQEVLREALAEMGSAILESDSFRETIAKLTDAIVKLIESGQIQLWAQNVVKAFDFIVAGAKKLIEFFGQIKSVIEKTAAFAGGFVGGQGGIKARLEAGREAAAAIEEIRADLKADEGKKLEEIREKKEATRKERDARERPLVEAAKQRGFQAGTSTEETRRFSQLRRIGANIIGGAAGGTVEKKQLTVLEDMKKQNDEMIKVLKDKRTGRTVF